MTRRTRLTFALLQAVAGMMLAVALDLPLWRFLLLSIGLVLYVELRVEYGQRQDRR